MATLTWCTYLSLLSAHATELVCRLVLSTTSTTTKHQPQQLQTNGSSGQCTWSIGDHPKGCGQIPKVSEFLSRFWWQKLPLRRPCTHFPPPPPQHGPNQHLAWDLQMGPNIPWLVQILFSQKRCTSKMRNLAKSRPVFRISPPKCAGKLRNLKEGVC